MHGIQNFDFLPRRDVLPGHDKMPTLNFTVVSGDELIGEARVTTQSDEGESRRIVWVPALRWSVQKMQSGTPLRLRITMSVKPDGWIPSPRSGADGDGGLKMRASFVIVAVLSCAASAIGDPMADSAKEHVLNLAFVPQETTGEHGPTSASSIMTRPVTLSSFRDERPRAESDLIGEGTDDDDRPFPWRASSSVVDFARDVFVRTATGWGIRLEDGQDLLLTIRLARFYVQEKDQAVGSTYASDVRVGFELRNSAGRSLCSGVVSGSAHRYGRKRSADNCNEVLSDAMKEAYARVFDDESLQAAWSGTVAFTGAGGRTITASALLAELVELKNRGLGLEVLVGYVKQQKLSSPLSAQDLVEWKEAGMSDSIIAAALERASGEK